MLNDPITDPPHPLDLVLLTKAPETTLSIPGILIEKITGLYNRMGEHPDIVDKATFDSMRSLVRDASKLKGEIETCRQRAKEPFLRVGQSIDQAAGKYTSQIEEVITEGKRQEAAFLTERDRKIAEDQRRHALAEAAAQKDVSRPTPPLTAVLATEAIDAPISKRKKVVVTNPALLPAKYWMINMELVTAETLAGEIIPGVELQYEQVLAAR